MNQLLNEYFDLFKEDLEAGLNHFVNELKEVRAGRANPKMLECNICHRFRHAEQYTPQELQYMSLYEKGECELRSGKGNLFFLQPKKKSKYVDKKMAKLAKMPSCKFACFNSLNLAGDEDLKKIVTWIETRIGIK